MAPILVRRPTTPAQPQAAQAAAIRRVQPGTASRAGAGPLPAPPSRAEIVRFRQILAALPVALVLDLEPERRLARLGQRVVKLARREFALLTHLVQAAPDTASRQEIAQAVWGDPAVAANRSIDVHVARLREKLGQTGLILTERGRGYRLNPDARVRTARPTATAVIKL